MRHENQFGGDPACTEAYPPQIDETFEYCPKGKGGEYCLGVREYGESRPDAWVVRCGGQKVEVEACKSGCESNATNGYDCI